MLIIQFKIFADCTPLSEYFSHGNISKEAVSQGNAFPCFVEDVWHSLLTAVTYRTVPEAHRMLVHAHYSICL